MTENTFLLPTKQREANILYVLHSFFEGFYSVPHLFHRMIKSKQIRWKDNYYTITLNSHPECVQVKQTIVKKYGDPRLQDGGFWGKCPEKYRHMLPKERQ